MRRAPERGARNQSDAGRTLRTARLAAAQRGGRRRCVAPGRAGPGINRIRAGRFGPPVSRRREGAGAGGASRRDARGPESIGCGPDASDRPSRGGAKGRAQAVRRAGARGPESIGGGPDASDRPSRGGAKGRAQAVRRAGTRGTRNQSDAGRTLRTARLAAAQRGGRRRCVAPGRAGPGINRWRAGRFGPPVSRRREGEADGAPRAGARGARNQSDAGRTLRTARLAAARRGGRRRCAAPERGARNQSVAGRTLRIARLAAARREGRRRCAARRFRGRNDKKGRKSSLRPQTGPRCHWLFLTTRRACLIRARFWS